MIWIEWSLRFLNLGGVVFYVGIKVGDYIFEINGLNVRWDKFRLNWLEVCVVVRMWKGLKVCKNKGNN